MHIWLTSETHPGRAAMLLPSGFWNLRLYEMTQGAAGDAACAKWLGLDERVVAAARERQSR